MRYYQWQFPEFLLEELAKVENRSGDRDLHMLSLIWELQGVTFRGNIQPTIVAWRSELRLKLKTFRIIRKYKYDT